MNTDLINIMCQYNLYNRSDTRKFLIKYHPDRIAAGQELPFKIDSSKQNPIQFIMMNMEK